MPHEREERLFKFINKSALIFVGSAVLVLSLGYLLLDSFGPRSPGFWHSLASLGLALIPNLISSAMLFLAVDRMFREVQEMRTQKEQEALVDAVSTRLAMAVKDKGLVERAESVRLYSNVREVPWGDIIKGSSCVDICVHFWGRWLSENQETFRAHFDLGGTVRLVLPNPDNDELIRAIKTRFPEYEDEARLKEDIRDTRTRLVHLVEKSTHKRAKAEVYYVDKLTWYCGVRCDLRYLVLSFYEHARVFQTQSPTVFIDLSVHSKPGEWFDREFGDLTDHAVNREVTPRERRTK